MADGTGEEVVKLSDGRLVTFVGKKRMHKESVVGEDGTLSVRIDFRNGETRTFVLPPALINRFALHGAEQKIGDSAAGEKDIEDAVLAIDETIDSLNKGEWTTRAEGNGMSGTSVLLRALVELTGKAVDEVKAFLKGKTQAEKTALRTNGRLKPIIERLEAEKVSKGQKIDTDAMLDTL